MEGLGDHSNEFSVHSCFIAQGPGVSAVALPSATPAKPGQPSLAALNMDSRALKNEVQQVLAYLSAIKANGGLSAEELYEACQDQQALTSLL